MWNGDSSEGSAQPTTEIISPETLLQLVTEARDQYKAEAARYSTSLIRIETEYQAAQTQLRQMLEEADDADGNYITFSVDDLKELCNHLKVAVTKTVTFEANVTVRFQVELPVWASPDDVTVSDVEVHDNMDVTVVGADDVYVEGCNVESVDRAY